MHRTAGHAEVDSVVEEEVEVVAGEITVVKKDLKQKTVVEVKESTTPNQRRNHVDREVVTTEEDAVAEDAVVVEEADTGVAHDRVVKDLVMNHALMVMIITKEIATRAATEVAEEEATQEDALEGSEDVQDVLPLRVPVTKEVITAITIVAVISIQIINEETEMIVEAIAMNDEGIAGIVMVIVATVEIVVIAEIAVTAEIGVIEVIAEIVTEVSVVIAIEMIIVKVEDHEEEDTDATEKLLKEKMVRRAAQKTAEFEKSPIKWRKSRSKVETIIVNHLSRTSGERLNRV